MEDILTIQMKKLRLMGKEDKRYRLIERDFHALGVKLSKMAADLTEEQQNLLWDYICTSDALDHRLLEIACMYIPWENAEV